uniref:Secreted protein n=1 Tax=Triticum urartu TaxID=4572 RepID=A0A8R7TFH9_TRIUA
MQAQINIFLWLLHGLLKTCFEAPRPHEIGSFLYCKRHPVSHLAVMKSCNNNSGPFTLRSQNCGVGAGPHRLDEGSSWRKAYHQLLKAS